MSGLSLHDAAQVLLPPEPGLPYLRHDRAHEQTLVPGGLTIEHDRIAALVPRRDLPAVDCSGCAVIPGFVDCHTHLPFAGWRAAEYERKATGVPYETIAREGGGIQSSARSFATARDDEILAQARTLAWQALRHGTTTFEGKCGYGLTPNEELRALRLLDRLADELPQTVVSTALLAHAVPPGHTPRSWLDVVAELLPRVTEQTRAEALDLFVESIAFGLDELRRCGELASAHGLTLRAHVEQLSTMGSVPVALRAGARSVDHLACLPVEDVPALAAAECAAVLLPGAEFLGDEQTAPARALADAGAICVLATDLNPGTSPIASLPLIVGLAVRRYGFDAREALLACTLNAAWVLERSASVGSLEVGKRADVVLLDGPVEQVAYRFGHNPVAAVLVAGEPVWVREDQAWRFPA